MGKRSTLFIKRTAKKLWSHTLDFFFERIECPACRCESAGLCSVCRGELRPWSEFTFEGVTGRAMIHYSGTAKKLIYGFKKRLSFDALESLCLVMDDWLRDNRIEDYDYIIPVTSIKSNLISRGFDPAVLLAEHLAQKTGLPLLNCIKNKGKKEHKSLNYSQRLAASENSFKIQPRFKARIKDQRILLFDDVMTSGATILALTKLLEASGAKQVEFLVLERSTG